MTTLKISAAVLLLATAACAQLGGGKGGVGEQQGYGHGGYYHTPHYNYEYGVTDTKTGDSKRHKETREGDSTHGEYSFTESDGTVRTVKYQVNGKSGFVATVSHSGHSKHPAQYTQYYNAPAEKQEEQPAKPIVLQDNEDNVPVAVAPAPAHFTQAWAAQQQQQEHVPQQQHVPQQPQIPLQQYVPQYQYVPQQQQQQQYVPEVAAPAHANAGNREIYGVPLRYLPPPSAAPAPVHDGSSQQVPSGVPAQQHGQYALQGAGYYNVGDNKNNGLLSLNNGPDVASLFAAYEQAGLGYGKGVVAQGGLGGAQGGLHNSYGLGGSSYEIAENDASGEKDKEETPVRAPVKEQPVQGGQEVAQGLRALNGYGKGGLTLATFGTAQKEFGQGAIAAQGVDFGNFKGAGLEGFGGNYGGYQFSQAELAKALEGYEGLKGAGQFSFDGAKDGYAGFSKSLNGFRPIFNGKGSYGGLDEYAGVQADAPKAEVVKSRPVPIVKSVRYIPAVKIPKVLRPVTLIHH
ncbi:Hypothetical predicted protein [Cloeon dipterum]|uniref:Uncharacterized protein n=1 Tax=Cloeon dipterum TaxID=197152 RepID=A0A8S1DCF5_9INSE|nr:Hypothetical predicted protein [Cloeon dipterum]